MAQKEDLYKRIKIAGMISFIPMVLAAGPLGGYIIGTYIKNKFNLSSVVLYISIGIGFIASITEAVRIIRLVLKVDTKAKNG